MHLADKDTLNTQKSKNDTLCEDFPYEAYKRYRNAAYLESTLRFEKEIPEPTEEQIFDIAIDKRKKNRKFLSTSIDKTAHDWAKVYNECSKEVNYEYASYISFYLRMVYIPLSVNR